MALRWFIILNLISSILFVINVIPSSAQDARKAYIVYMGKKPEIEESEIPNFHVKVLRDVVDNNNDIAHEDLLLYSYKRSFHGFSAMLTEQEAQKLAEMEGVVSVFPDKKAMPKTTRSWDFVGFPETYKRSKLESDVIIGVVDSGIWPELDVFSDDGLGPPPKKWKGICQFDKSFTCNNKIIGGRYYYAGGGKEKSGGKEREFARDYKGHGTHCASIAAGSMVSNASVKGLGFGTARGLPSARIAVYKICWHDGCKANEFLAAIDDAIADGVDILSVSTGMSPVDYWIDAFTIGAFHATINGILVSTSAGNEGPDKKTVKNIAPWQLSVAATTTDRKFITKIKLGNGNVYEGVNENFIDLEGEFHPLIYGGDAPSKKKGSHNKRDARFCTKGSLDEDLIQDKIVLCDKGPKKVNAGSGAVGSAIGVILTGKKAADEAVTTGEISCAGTYVSLEDNSNIYKYINKTRNATATIWKSEAVKDVLAPHVPPFSSRGPNALNPNILKPDIAAPGFSILAGCAPPRKCDGVQYKFHSGTSMACPHVSAVAAYVKSFHPKWSPAAIKSAIMTTATPMSAKTNPLAEFAYGAGLINPSKAPYPGLVYDLTIQDYVDFLCVQGYSQKQLDLITENETKTTPCSSKSKNETINNFNYPAIALLIEDPEDFNGVFHRTVTNVGSPNSVYKAKVVTSSGLKVDVHPNVLSFTSLEEKKSFVVMIKGPIEKTNMVSASLVWDDGVFQVRSPIVVYI